MEEQAVYCPNCGEPITLLIDTSAPQQEYTEDCEVCCRPIIVSVQMQGEDLNIDMRHEDA